MTRQVMKIDINSAHLVCKYDYERKEFTLYQKYWCDGWHTKKLVSYDGINPILWYIDRNIRFNA